MAGNVSRGAVISAQTRGWDPTVIVDRETGARTSIAAFDVDQGNAGGRCVGRIPGGAPTSVADGYDVKNLDQLRFDAPPPFRTATHEPRKEA